MNPAKGKKDEVAAVTADELRSQLILKKMVGRGGFAAVYLGTYKGQEVAVKIILAEHVTPNSAQVKLFLREGQYMSRCTHRSIVKCHAICQLPADFPGMEALGHKNATWALVLEYIPGGSLAALLMKQMAQTRRTYSDYEAYCWVVDVADALRYMHNAPRPVMHRDVKADNVLLTVDESGRPTAKLMDFGLMAALDGKNPMLRRRSVSPADGLGRGSTASIARASVGSNSGAGRGNLAAPSVATYYNDSTHEPGKIFYLMDELPQATVAALPGPGGSRRPSVDFGAGAAGGMNPAAFATAVNLAGLGGSTSPNTQFGFNVAASSRGSSLEGGGATGGAAPGAAGAASGLPWGGASRPGSRSGTGNGASPGVPGFGTLVPLNEEASFHGNTAGYAAMLLHQQQHQQQQQQRRAQRRASGDATVAAPAAAATGREGSTGALHSSLHGLVGVGGDSASGAPGGSLSNSLHGKGSVDSSGIEGSSPGDSPLASGKWQLDGLAAGSVRLRVDTDDITPARPHTLAGGIGGDAAIAAAAAAMIGSAPAPGQPGGPGRKMGSRRVSDDANGSLVRMSAQVVAVPPIEPKAALEAELPPGDDADLILRSAIPLPPLPSHTTPRPSMDASGRPMSANKLAAADVTAAEGLPVMPMHPPMPQVHATPVSSTASARAASHDAVPAVDVVGVAPRTGSLTDGTGAAGSNRKSRLACTSASVPGTQTPPQGCSTPNLCLVEQQQQQERTTCGAALAKAAPAMKGTPPVMLTDGGAASEPLLTTPLQKSLGAGSDPFARQSTPKSAGSGGGGVSAPQCAQRPAGCNRGSSGSASTPEGGGGVVSIAAMLQGRYEQDFQWVWRLTGQTGSCMYMAPEVFRGLPYNEKVDVFSFGVLVYEIFSRTLTLIAGLNLRDLRMRMMDTPEGYAEYVAGGYRPSKPLAMPEPLFELISACWSEDPCNRPSMAEVVASLEALQQQYAPSPKTEAPTSACGCIIS